MFPPSTVALLYRLASGGNSSLSSQDATAFFQCAQLQDAILTSVCLDLNVSSAFANVTTVLVATVSCALDGVNGTHPHKLGGFYV